MTTHKKCAIYVRVSTLDQSTELQQSELIEFVKSRGWKIHNIYEDKATGTNDNRPQLKAMLMDVRSRKVDIVITWKLDRLFRSLKSLVMTLQDFNDLGVAFVSLRDQIDLTTASGRLMMHMLASFAEFEADLIRSRVVAGLENAKRKGKRLGRPKIQKDDQIHQLRKKGLSIREIAKKLGISTMTVQRSLKSQL